jgi:hypothetical protein
MWRTALAALGTLILAGTPVLAHHSYAAFAQDQVREIEGDVEEFVFANPHVTLKVRTRDSIVYIATMRSATQLGRHGFAPTTIKVGDHVIVSGSPARDAKVHELALIRELRRPADGWSWKR